MSVLQAEVYRAFRSLNVDDDRALDAAVALSSAMEKGEAEALRNLRRVEDDTTKGFSKRDADIDTIRKDVSVIRLDVVGIKGELALHRWMLGFIVAMQVAVLFKAFTH